MGCSQLAPLKFWGRLLIKLSAAQLLAFKLLIAGSSLCVSPASPQEPIALS